MTNDAKLGLVVGVGLVIVVAVVFFRKDLAPSNEEVTVTTAGPRTVRVQPTRLTGVPGQQPGLRHTVRGGETLDGLARQYYGDSERASQIFAANRGQLPTLTGELKEGTELFIPMPVQTASARQ